MPNQFGSNSFGAKTASAGTPITYPIPPVPGAYTKIAKILYTAGATSHTLTAMRVLGTTRLSSNASSGQPVINLAADPGPSGNGIASGDWLIVKNDDRSVFVAKVSSVSTLAITLTANLATAITAATSAVWFFGVPTDTDPRGNESKHLQFTMASGTQTIVSESIPLCVVGSWSPGEPLLLHSSNETNAGQFDRVGFFYER